MQCLDVESIQTKPEIFKQHWQHMSNLRGQMAKINNTAVNLVS